MWSLNGERPARSQIKRSLIRLPTIFYLKILIQRESKADKHIVGSAWRSRTVWSVCGGKISAKIHKTNAKIASFSLIVREQERPATPLFGPYHHRKARFTLRRAQPLRIHTGERKTGGFEVSSASVLDSLAIAEANIGGSAWSKSGGDHSSLYGNLLRYIYGLLWNAGGYKHQHLSTPQTV